MCTHTRAYFVEHLRACYQTPHPDRYQSQHFNKELYDYTPPDEEAVMVAPDAEVVIEMVVQLAGGSVSEEGVGAHLAQVRQERSSCHDKTKFHS